VQHPFMPLRLHPSKSRLFLALCLHLALSVAFAFHTHSIHQVQAKAPITPLLSRMSENTSRKSPRRSTRLENDAQNKKGRTSIQTPSLTFGVIADIQHAPIPDGYSYSGAPRYYSHAIDVARHAADHFQNDKVGLVLNLGDIVDGKCQAIEKHGGTPLPAGVDPGLKVIDDVVEALSSYQHGPILHAYGNHCLYNADRATLQSKLGIPFVKEPCGDLVGYWSHVQDGVRFVILDSYDISKEHRCKTTSRKHLEAHEILLQNNPNYPENENSPEGLVGVAKRFVAFNGGIGSVQLEWLRKTLTLARENKEKVVIMSHQPIHPGSTVAVCLVWNYKEVLATLREYKDVVLASFSGHAHKGGYKQDDVSGIHFRVFEAALENPHPHKTYAMVDMYDDRMEIRGFGNCKSATYRYNM
jgi:manganese-dependent ADP-ribose/CDP-alcohol diphosphatase